MKKLSGFTLTEMLVSLIVASLVFLLLGSVSGAGSTAYSKLRREAGVSQDMVYGFKLIQSRVRRSQTLNVLSASGSWQGQRLVVDNEAFGIYSTGSSKDFVHLPNASDLTDREVITSFANSDTVNLNLSITLGKLVTVQLSGSKDNVPFDLTSVMRKRI